MEAEAEEQSKVEGLDHVPAIRWQEAERVLTERLDGVEDHEEGAGDALEDEEEHVGAELLLRERPRTRLTLDLPVALVAVVRTIFQMMSDSLNAQILRPLTQSLRSFRHD